MVSEQHVDTHETKQPHDKDMFLEVAISTTSGFFPSEGYERVSTHQKVRVQLDHAAKTLGLVGTEGWVASIDKRPINSELSYVENGLSGTIEIDWGPSEGGGGYA